MQNRCFRVGTMLFTLVLAACSWQGAAPPTTRGVVPFSESAVLPQGEGFKALYAFPGGAGGQTPDGRVAFINGSLFGTAHFGGTVKNCTFTSITPGCGLIYSIDPAGHEKIIYEFKGPANKDGMAPNGGLLLFGNKLYGATTGGGRGADSVCKRTFLLPPGCGTIYDVDTAGTERVVYRFKGGTDGEGPGALVPFNGMLYGVTVFGGTGCGYSNDTPGCGVVFSVDPSGHEKAVYRFKGGLDGAFPLGELVPLHGSLYGITALGGSCSSSSQGCGTVFKVTPSGVESVIYAFKGERDGQLPSALIAFEGSLYGTTVMGGCLGSCKYSPLGTFFKVTASGRETIVHRFAGGKDDSMHPQGRLVLYHGTIYGTGGGGAQLGGTIYTVTSKGVQLLYSFHRAPHPYNPVGLTLGPSSDVLYGESQGAKYDTGYVYSYSL